jgi:hypothetical protein
MAAYIIQITSAQDVLIPWFWGVFALMAGTTLIAYLSSWFGIKKGGEASILSLMAVMGIKIFICMGLAIVYLMNFKVKSAPFLIEFFSLYFLFTAFEVYFLLRNLRHPK